MVQPRAALLTPGAAVDGSPAEPAADNARNEVGTDDSLARLERLKAEFDANAASPPEARAEPHPKTRAWRDHRRVIKAAVGLVLLIAVGWMPVRALLQTTSTEAVVNARL